MSDNKGYIIGIFVKRRSILSFLETLRNDYGVRIDRTFVNEIEGNRHEYLVTFKAKDKDTFIKNIQGSSVVHVKNGCIFSINALNRLIEIEKGDSDVPNSEFELNWDMYKDTLIVMTNGELTVSKLTKIEDKNVLFT